jgi:hydrogenase maturation protease
MKPVLVVGLGNSLMGDDGVGWHVAQRLATDPRLPDAAEVIDGGTDLLRRCAEIEGRERVVVVDAMRGGDLPGSVHVFENSLPSDSARRHSHDLAVVEAIQLLRRFLSARIVLMTVSVSSAEFGGNLSPQVSACLPAIVNRALDECRLQRQPALIPESDVL